METTHIVWRRRRRRKGEEGRKGITGRNYGKGMIYLAMRVIKGKREGG